MINVLKLLLQGLGTNYGLCHIAVFSIAARSDSKLIEPDEVVPIKAALRSVVN